MSDEMAPNKRLKCSEPDLKVIVGSEGAEKTFLYHSIGMATCSDYIDALLASPMKESQTRVISFPDIEPDDWLKMIEFMEDPFRAKEMTIDSAVKFAPIYDKYGFHKGIDVCSRILISALDHSYLPHESRIEYFLLAEKLGMKYLRDAALNWFKERLSKMKDALDFSLADLRLLVPIIVKEKSLLHTVQATEEEVVSPLWPTLFRHQVLLREYIYNRNAYEEYEEYPDLDSIAKRVLGTQR